MSELGDNIFLIAITLGYLWSSAVLQLVKVDYFDIPCKIFGNTT